MKVQTPKNEILQREITKENCIKCIIASSKWTRVVVCVKFTDFGFYAAMRVWSDSWRRRPAKTVDANLVWLCPLVLSMLRLTSGLTARDHVCLLAAYHLEHMLWN